MTDKILDDTDLKILRILQQDPDQPMGRIGEQVGLSHTPTWRRIRKMQESGVIVGKRIELDHARIGLDVSIFVMVRLSAHAAETLEAFEKATQNVPEIMQCYTMSGDIDYLLRVVVATVGDYEKTVKAKLLKLPGVGTLSSHFALNEIRNSGILPL